MMRAQFKQTLAALTFCALSLTQRLQNECWHFSQLTPDIQFWQIKVSHSEHWYWFCGCGVIWLNEGVTKPEI